jgi:hypothetical protein
MILSGDRPTKLSLVRLYFGDRGVMEQIWRQRAFRCPLSFGS